MCRVYGVILFICFLLCTNSGWRRWKRLWKGWVVIPTGIGVSVLTVLQWRRFNWSEESQNKHNSFQITCYRAIPLRAMSRFWGWISSQHIPLSIRCWLYTQYANIYGVNLDEASHSLDHYNTLCDFFIRQLKEGARPIAEHECIVSPADGTIIHAGRVTSCNVEQIKGVTYPIKTFLGELTWKTDGDSYGYNESGFTNYYEQLPRKFESSTETTRKRRHTARDLFTHDEHELVHLNGKYREVNNRVLGWLVFYFQFCVKDLLINSFFFGVQVIVYGIKSTSVVLSNGKISRGASYLRSQFSLSGGTSKEGVFQTQIDASATSGSLTYDSDSGDERDYDCDPDWEAYKRRLLRNQDNELYQYVVYLAPGDYHRFHSPADWNVKFRRHFQGELLSVHPRITKWIPELFSLNERAVYVGDWQHGFFSMVAVGATNVGSIKIHSDEELQTNTRRWRNGPRHKDRLMNTCWKKGEEVGAFRFGSTIVLLFEAPKDFEFDVKPGDKIKVGQRLTTVPQSSSL